METIAEPKALKESVTALYRKYVQGGAKRQDLDTDMQKEYNRPAIEHMELALSRLHLVCFVLLSLSLTLTVFIFLSFYACSRQRDYLEKSVDSLKRKLEKDSQAHRIDNMRIMQARSGHGRRDFVAACERAGERVPDTRDQ